MGLDADRCPARPADSLDVPVHGGLPIGHGDSPVAVLGTMMTVDADNGLEIQSAAA
jgi:hypothetical protein